VSLGDAAEEGDAAGEDEDVSDWYLRAPMIAATTTAIAMRTVRRVRRVAVRAGSR
jgi:hypothetical protein